MKVREAKFPPQGKVRLTEAIERLVKLYDAWGKADEAAKWKKVSAERLTAALLRDYAWPLLWGRPVW